MFFPYSIINAPSSTRTDRSLAHWRTNNYGTVWNYDNSSGVVSYVVVEAEIHIICQTFYYYISFPKDGVISKALVGSLE